MVVDIKLFSCEENSPTHDCQAELELDCVHQAYVELFFDWNLDMSSISTMTLGSLLHKEATILVAQLYSQDSQFKLILA